jgi:hypothetical protein
VILEFFVVFILAALAGTWAIAAGVLMELDPLLVYLVHGLRRRHLCARNRILGPGRYVAARPP